MFAQYASLPRLFVTEALACKLLLRLPKAASHYLCNVLRRQVGDFARLFNGRDGEYLARIVDAGSKACVVEVDIQLRPQEDTPSLTLIFAPLRKERLHFLVEKAVELGVTHLIPLLTARTTHRTFNVERASAHILEATEQSEHMTIPTIAPLGSLPELLATWPATTSLFFCKERSGAEPLAQSLLNHNSQAPAFLVGPEGGFTTEESLLLESYPFVHPVSLGFHILRSETAALSALGFWKLYSTYQNSPPSSSIKGPSC